MQRELKSASVCAFLFPGQGAQWQGMGADLYQGSAIAREIFAQADQTLEFSLSRLCFEGPEEALRATENAQPAILSVSVALLAMLAGGLEQLPAFVREHALVLAGHSLGHYTALVSAGALSFPSALGLVRLRGMLMAERGREVAGGMAAVIGMDDQSVSLICEEISTPQEPVVIANYNAPGQLVLSGASGAVDRAALLARERGALNVVPLNTSGAFHSPLMTNAAVMFAQAVRRAPIADAAVPVLSNRDATPLAQARAIRADLARQLSSPVRWRTIVERMVAQGVTRFVEIGPGEVLSGLTRRIAPKAGRLSIQRTGDVEAYRAALEMRA